MIASTTITGLKTTIFADEGFDEVLVQTGAVNVDCWMQNGVVTKVVAPDGITFSGKAGTLTRPDNFDVTGLCDLVELATRIRAEREERAYDKAQAKRNGFIGQLVAA